MKFTSLGWTAVILIAYAGGCSAQPVAGPGPEQSSRRAAQSVAPLVVSADRHGWEFQGRRVLLIGDSVTQGWMELGTHFDQDAYVNALAARGINVLMLWSYIGIVDQIADSRIGYDAPEIWPWNRSGGTFDLQLFNDAYFDRLRSLVQLAGSKGIVVLITVHDGWTKTRFAGHPFNTANGGPLTDRSQYVDLYDYANEMPTIYDPAWNRQQKNQFFLEQFCDRLIQATADQPNVVYEMFNEGEWYNQTKLRAFEVHFLAFFKSRTSRVTMVNDDGVGGTDFRGEAACDSISWHHPNWTASTSAMDSFNPYAAAFAGVPAKPFFFSEPVPEYQGDASLHDALMRLMWGTVLGGSGFVVQNDTSYGFDPNTIMAGQASNRGAVYDLEGHCSRFFNASGVQFWRMAPHASLASTGVCLADPGREYAVYAQNGADLTLDLAGAAGSFTARFYNPRTGAFEPTFPVAGGAARTITKPSASDWVLHVVANARLAGDFDDDSDVDQEDFGHLQICMTGSGREVTDSGCLDAVLDGDGDVDEDDAALFLACLSGPGGQVSASCIQ
jgi:hypothetical protein